MRGAQRGEIDAASPGASIGDFAILSRRGRAIFAAAAALLIIAARRRRMAMMMLRRHAVKLDAVPPDVRHECAIPFTHRMPPAARHMSRVRRH